MNGFVRSLKCLDQIGLLLCAMGLTAFWPSQNTGLVLQTLLFGIAISTYFQFVNKRCVIFSFSLLQLALMVQLSTLQTGQLHVILLTQSLLLTCLYMTGLAKLLYKIISVQTETLFKILTASFYVGMTLLEDGFRQFGFFAQAVILILMISYIGLKVRYSGFKYVPILLILILGAGVYLFAGIGQAQASQQQPVAAESLFGWLWSGSAIFPNTEVTIKALFLVLGILVESLVAIKEMSRKHSDCSFDSLLPQLVTANFLSALLGFLPLSLPVGFNTISARNTVGRSVIWNGLIAVGLIALWKYSPILSSLLKSAPVAQIVLVLLASELIRFKELRFIFRKSKARFSVLLICCLLAVGFQNRPLAFVLGLFLELLIYVFHAPGAFGYSKSFLFKADSKLQSQHLEVGREAVVYSLERGFNFLYLDRHVEKIKQLGSGEVIVDFSRVMGGQDDFYNENYKELVTRLERIEEVEVHFHGLKEPWKKKSKGAPKEYQLKAL